jgi:putative transposase
MKKIMKAKNQAVPDEVLSKEFLSRFKTEADVSNFLKQLHAQVLEKMLEGKMDAHLGYEKNSVARNTLVIPVMAVMRRKFKPKRPIESIAVPKHERRGLPLKK